jgi:hypothetical protein
LDAHNAVELNRILEQRGRPDEFQNLKNERRSRMLIDKPVAIPLFVGKLAQSPKTKDTENG